MGVSRGVQPLVLIVDDDGPILDSLGEILEEEGYAVALARNGQEALAYLAANARPDCILLDVMMPVMNGYDFRRAQLRDPRLAAIPTLLLTAGHVDGRVAELRLSGWLRKPINLPLLLASVQQHCGPSNESSVAPFAGHVVHFYLEESRMLDRAAAHLADGLESHGPALAVCTEGHWSGLQDRLAERRLDPPDAGGRRPAALDGRQRHGRRASGRSAAGAGSAPPAPVRGGGGRRRAGPWRTHPGVRRGGEPAVAGGSVRRGPPGGERLEPAWRRTADIAAVLVRCPELGHRAGRSISPATSTPRSRATWHSDDDRYRRR